MAQDRDPLEYEPEITYQPPDDGGSRRRMMMLLTLAVVAGFIGVVWYAYDQGREAGSDAVAPVITADTAPVKTRPEDPGGMDVPHQDKTVYNNLTPGDEEADQVERLLPPPEIPLPPPAPAEAGADDGAAKTATPESAKEPAPEPAKETAETEPEEVGTETAKPATGSAAPPVPPVADAPPAPTGAGNGFRIQLASLASEAAARRAWQTLSARHQGELGDLNLAVERADLGAKGVFYRVQAGPLADRAAAESRCRALKAKNQGCLVIAP